MPLYVTCAQLGLVGQKQIRDTMRSRLIPVRLFRQRGARNDDEDRLLPASRQPGRHRAVVHRAVQDSLSLVLSEFVFHDNNRHKLADGASNCVR
jgi:hypothetical protein